MKNYKSLTCPNCNAPLPSPGINQHFVICEYCDSKIELEVTEAEAQLQETMLKEKMFDASQEEKLYKRDQNAKKRKTAGGMIALCVISYLLANYMDSSFFQFLFMIMLIPTIVVAANAFRSESIYEPDSSESTKSRWGAFTLCLIVGMFGIHYFYVGRIGKGILYLFTFGLFGFGWFIDMIIIATGKFRDANGQYLIS